MINIYFNKTLILVIISYLIAHNTFAQNNDSLKIIKTSKNSIFLCKDNKKLDSLTTYGLKTNKTFIKIKNKKVITSNFIIPGVGSFSNAYISLEVWNIVNEKFKGNCLKNHIK